MTQNKQSQHILIHQGYQKENCHRQSHGYSTEDKVLLQKALKTKFNQDVDISPYTVTEVRYNGTVCACIGDITHTPTTCATSPHLRDRVDFHCYSSMS